MVRIHELGITRGRLCSERRYSQESSGRNYSLEELDRINGGLQGNILHFKNTSSKTKPITHKKDQHEVVKTQEKKGPHNGRILRYNEFISTTLYPFPRSSKDRAKGSLRPEPTKCPYSPTTEIKLSNEY